MTDKRTHTSDCEWHIDQYPWECTCGAIPKKQAMYDLIAQDADLIDKLRDEDSYYRLQEKHWCIDSEELERQRLAAADRIEALSAENERLREALGKANEAHWFYYGNDCSSEQCRFSIHECIDEDFEWDNRPVGDHVLQIAGARPVPDMWVALHYFTEAEMDERQDDEPYTYTVHATEEEARAALAGDSHD
jgi:hypothetical protein